MTTRWALATDVGLSRDNNEDSAIALPELDLFAVADGMGVAGGAYPQQWDLAEFESAANCTLTFSENPRIGELNGKIVGNPSSLPPVAERLPDDGEPLNASSRLRPYSLSSRNDFSSFFVKVATPGVYPG